MDQETQEQYNKEVNQIIKDRLSSINQTYPVVREAYRNTYHWPEMDVLRHEISLCLIFGLHQAAITLINHLLESLLKYSLIVHDTKSVARNHPPRNRNVIESLVARFRPAKSKYGSADLGDNINRACGVGLITKEEKNQLHNFREQFRNANSHSDKDKTFGDRRILAQALSVDDGKLVVEQPETTLLSELIIGHGLAQAMQAEAEAVPYFLYMDGLVRRIRSKLFGAIKKVDCTTSAPSPRARNA